MTQTKIFCESGGCGAKIAAGTLSGLLKKLKKNYDPNLMVGFDSHDDGAVYRLHDNEALISTLDFFPMMIEDPYLFGQIAAANAMSDIFAMGGQVLTALNIVCFPESLDINLLGQILDGGNDKVIEAGAVLVGGHSIVDETVKYGLSVAGVVDPHKIYRNNTVQKGDALVITKKLGVGIVLSAKRVGAVSEEVFEETVRSMCTLNNVDLSDICVHACSDVTGFGLLVHLSEMLDGKFSAIVNAKSVPTFDHVHEYAEEFYISAAGQKNRNFIGNDVCFEIDDYAMEEILFDPQTSGGLLVSVPEEEVEKLQAKLSCWKIGNVVDRQEQAIIVR